MVSGFLFQGITLVHIAQSERDRYFCLLHFQLLPAKETKVLCVIICWDRSQAFISADVKCLRLC